MHALRRIYGLLAGLSVASAGLACGDKLSAVGGGIPFERIHPTHPAGRIVIYAPRDSVLRRVNDELRLADALARAGHAVLLVDGPEPLQQALAGITADVVLVDAAESGRLEVAGTHEAAPAILPVVYTAGDRAAPRVESRTQCAAQLTKRSTQKLVRAVNEILERRSRGAPPMCEQPRSLRGI
ncbi:MAG: hypothetical protein U1F14_01990 [Steroidobacteraceae bacterium]